MQSGLQSNILLKKNVYSILKISAPKTALGRSSAALESCVQSNNPAWVSDPFTVFIITKLIQGQAECLIHSLRIGVATQLLHVSYAFPVGHLQSEIQMLLDLKFGVGKLLLEKN